MGKMNQTEFGKAIGTSQQMVAKYIREGKLDGCYERQGRKTIIDYDKAVAALKDRLDPTRGGKGGAPGLEPKPGDADPVESIDLDGVDPDTVTLTDATKLDKLYAARLKKQKLDENAGKLIDKKEAVDGYAKVIVATKTKLLGVKAKVGPIISEAVPDPEIAAEVIQLIDDIHREALNDLARASE